MDGTTWIDPRYAELVEAWQEMKGERLRKGPVTPCRSCQHGLGTIMFVDLTTRKPIPVNCVCGANR